MILDRLPLRDRRAVMLGTLVLIPALGWTWGARPFFAALNEQREMAAREVGLLNRERTLVAEAPRIPEELAATRSALAAAELRAVRSDAAVTASVKFADYVRQVAGSNELLLTQASEQAADSLAGGVISLRLAVRGESDLRGILQFVRALESGTIRVRVASLHIERGRQNRNAAGVARPDDAREVLSLSAVIEAPAVITPVPREKGSER